MLTKLIAPFISKYYDNFLKENSDWKNQSTPFLLKNGNTKYYVGKITKKKDSLEESKEYLDCDFIYEYNNEKNPTNYYYKILKSLE